MISTATLLFIPVLPSAFCGAMSVGQRARGWLTLSWVLSLAIFVTINFAILFSHETFRAAQSGDTYIITGKAIGAAIATSTYWIVTGVLTFFVIRRMRMGRNAGGEG